MSDYQVYRYNESMRNEWECFIEQEAVNGTFLQSRNFLEYHPKDRFEDFSLLIYDNKKHLVAVCPACIVREENGKTLFVSHKGSTFGGILIGRKYYSMQKVLDIIQVLEEYLTQNDIFSITYKITPDIFCVEKSDLLQYCLYYKQYVQSTELSMYVDFQDYKEDVYSNLTTKKRTNVNNCLKSGMVCKTLETDTEIEEFYRVLCSNLEKYGTTPVHSLEELLDFKNDRLKENCEFMGVYYQGKMVAGGMLFRFSNKVVHTQYLCALSEYNNLSPMTFLYYSILVEMKERHFQIVSWGITTEEEGMYINTGLAKSKEAYGSKYAVNRTYRKQL